MRAKDFIPVGKPRNFVAKNAMKTTSGAGAHRDKKKEQKQGYEKHKGKDVAEGESALEKFRKGAAEREKKHAQAEKEMKSRHASGKEDMKGAIDRLEKHLSKE